MRPLRAASSPHYLTGEFGPKSNREYTNLIDTHRADTLGDLAKELNIPADKLKASVERYNGLCAKGHDDEQGCLHRQLFYKIQ
jgi:hypothetical protein